MEDHDPVWLELRHAHIADVCPLLAALFLTLFSVCFFFINGFFQASERLHEKMTNFVSKNKAAQIHQGSRLALLCCLLLGVCLVVLV